MPSFLDDYEPVEDRLRAFWKDHPGGRIETDLVAHSDGEYIVKAGVWRNEMDPVPASTGYAAETVTEKGVNATSALENCETSAIGRALANLGYAPKGKRPSREEMASVSVSGKGGAEEQSGAGEGSPASDCDHHYPTGVPAKVIKGGKEFCRLCGQAWVSAMEGTTEDLGSA